MKVFISWSGEASREVALALRDWFPKVLQGVMPFVSSKDIDKGANWTTILADELSRTSFGVLCLTPENLLSPWLNYEAGAISTAVDARVCPVLHGMEKGAVGSPLGQLQLTETTVEDFILLMSTMVKAGSFSLSEAAITEAVRVWWPQLEEALTKIRVPAASKLTESPEPPQPESTTEELLLEILSRLRRVEGRLPTRSIRDQVVTVSPTGRVLSNSKSVEKNVEGVAAVANAVFEEWSYLRATGIQAHDNQIEATFDSLPSPIPTEAYERLGNLSKKYNLTINLVSAEVDRSPVEFRDGSASEPPF